MAKLDLAGTVHDVTRIEGAGGGLRIGAETMPAGYRLAGDGVAEVTVAGQVHRVRVAAGRDGRVWVHAGGRAWMVSRVEPMAGAAARGGAASDAMLAAMPGTVIAVQAEPGTAVAAGEAVLVIESMKLETTVAAPRDGVVAEIGFGAGATFDKGAVLARLAPVDESGTA